MSSHLNHIHVSVTLNDLLSIGCIFMKVCTIIMPIQATPHLWLFACHLLLVLWIWYSGSSSFVRSIFKKYATFSEQKYMFDDVGGGGF